MGTSITPKFDPGDVIWFVNPSSLFAISSVVIETQIVVTDTVSITYHTALGYMNEENSFATQQDLADSFAPQQAP